MKKKNLLCPVSGVVCPAIPITPGWDPPLADGVNRRQLKLAICLKFYFKMLGKNVCAQ